MIEQPPRSTALPHGKFTALLQFVGDNAGTRKSAARRFSEWLRQPKREPDEHPSPTVVPDPAASAKKN